MTSEEKRSDVTADLSGKVVAKLRREFALVAQEVWVDSRHRVDFVAFSPAPAAGIVRSSTESSCSSRSSRAWMTSRVAMA